MQKLTVLIFSRNDVEKALTLVKNLYEVADEIVLVDSSNKAQWNVLLKKKKELRLTKLRLFYAIALGYPDPLRMYALSKCSNDWILLIDTDEKLSDELKKDIKRIIKGTTSSAFAIKRYEEVKEGHLPKLFTWQIRLFRKSRTLFMGNLHEQPKIKGALHKLDDQYYMEHVLALMHHTRHGDREYRSMRMFDRFTYREYNERFKIGESRLSMSGNKTGVLGTVANSLLRIYEIIGLKDLDKEVSLFDYWFYFFSTELVFAVKGGSIIDFLESPWKANSYAKQYRVWMNAPDSKEMFAIAQSINQIGIIKFLGLDKDSVVNSLNRKYANKEQGVTLLIDLLKRRYEGKNL